MLDFIMTYPWEFTGACVIIAVAILWGFFIIAPAISTANFNEPAFAPYPFDDPNFVHVGFNTEQWGEVTTLPAIMATFAHCPRHKNKGTDALFCAMTEPEFLAFYYALYKHSRVLIAEAAKRQEAFLSGPAFALSEMLIGLEPIKRRISETFPESELKTVEPGHTNR